MRTFLLISLLLTGCGAGHYRNSTFFLKEDDKLLYNFKGDICLESGYQTLDIGNDEYKLITFYSNCDIRSERKMKEWEPELWGYKPHRKFSLEYNR